MFTNEEGFNKVFSTTRGVRSWQFYREKIAHKYFNGNLNFKFDDLIRKSRFIGAITITKNPDGSLKYIISDNLDSSATGWR